MSLRAGSVGVVLALALLSAAPAAADNPPSKNDSQAAACSRFAWPVTREKAWFAGKLPTAHSGERVAKSDEGILLALKPTRTFNFFLAPEHKPSPDSFSGNFVIFGVAAPGLYQITLSEDASVDVFENGVRLKSTAFAGDKDCPGLRKSVRFDLTPGAPITVQISNSPKDQIKVAIAPAS